MKMRMFFSVLSFMTAWQAMAGQVTTNVVAAVDSGRTERVLVLSSVDGRVYKSERTKELRTYLQSLVGRNVSITFSENGTERFIQTITPVGAVSDDINMFVSNIDDNGRTVHAPAHPDRAFEPTDVGTVERATQIFNSLDNTNRDQSQCFKRAHMWAFDLWSRLGINSTKMFIFYTNRFRELEDFDWWFHVAPALKVNGETYVIDRGFDFIDSPLKPNDWKAKVSPSLRNTTCAVINNQADYDNNRWSRLCFFREMPMHYFRPLDLQNLDRRNMAKTGWELDELQDARRAFKDGDRTYEALDSGRSTITH